MKRPAPLALVAAIILVPATAGLLIHALTTGSSASPAASGPPEGAYRGSEPPAGIRVPDFTLRDYRGKLVRTRTLRGQVVLVTFLDTDCKRSARSSRATSELRFGCSPPRNAVKSSPSP